ncbi:MAG TPA: toxin-antitoxin system YwqK family antitoxin [Phycisphaerae bacterium]|nr:toxin-antitoxin system YwqK family antitoxin [Phycisphaerae bacterium]
MKAAWPSLLAAVSVLATSAPTLSAQETPPAEGPGDVRTVVLDKQAAQKHYLLRGYARDLPDDHKLQIVFNTYYDPSKGIRERVQSVTPIDADGRPDGEAVHLLPIHLTAQYRSGVKDGIERVYGLSPRGGEYVKAEIPWKSGKVHGVKKTYHPNKAILNETAYVEGTESGQGKSYTRDGKLLRVVPYKDGARHGVQTDYWPRTGKVRRTIPFQAGKIEGVVKEYYPDGKPHRDIPFKSNLRHGVERELAADGKLLRVTPYRDGARDGETIENHPQTGKPARITPYKTGLVHGVVREYHVNGKLKRQTPFAKEVVHGIENEYDPKGDLIRTRYWLNGREVGKPHFEKNFKPADPAATAPAPASKRP